MVKKEIRVLGIDDAPFDKFKDKKCLIIGVFFRGGNFLDGVLSSKVAVDGSDSTAKMIKMVRKQAVYSGSALPAFSRFLKIKGWR